MRRTARLIARNRKSKPHLGFQRLSGVGPAVFLLSWIALVFFRLLERLQINHSTVSAVADGRGRQRLESALRYFKWKKLLNFWRIEYQLRTGRTKVSGYPYEWEIDTTNICQLRCPLCSTGRGTIHRDMGVMHFDTFARLIDEIKDYCVWLTLYSWGEPFLNKEIDRFLAYAHQASIATTISTNLNKPLTPDMAQRIIQAGLDTLIVSIDGTTQEVYEQYRVGGWLDRVLANLKLLVDTKQRLRSRTPYIEWQFIVMRQNQHQIPEARAMAREIGVDAIVFKKVDFPLWEQDPEVARRWLPVGADKYLRENPFDRPYHEEGARCWRLWRSSVVNWDGGCAPCCYLTDKADDFGDVTNAPFRTVWNNDKYQAARELFKIGVEPAEPVGCVTCPVYTGSKAARSRGHHDLELTGFHARNGSETAELPVVVRRDGSKRTRRLAQPGPPEPSQSRENRPQGMAPWTTVWRRMAVRDGPVAHLREVALLVVAYFVYMFVRRVIVPGAHEIGVEHAEMVISFELSTGLFLESQLQDMASTVGKPLLVAFNYLYIFTYFPVLLTSAIIFYVVDRERYRYYRGLVLLSFAAALVIFVALPLAPPRLIPNLGITDTIALYGPTWYASREAMAYYNAYAAMPSLHFAWTVLFGFLFWNTGPRLLKVLAVLYPMAAFGGIIITGNHYIIDALGGASMMFVVYVIHRLLFRRGTSRRPGQASTDPGIADVHASAPRLVHEASIGQTPPGHSRPLPAVFPRDITRAESSAVPQCSGPSSSKR